MHHVPTIDAERLGSPGKEIGLGTIIAGRYVLESALGAGGMARAFLARDIGNGVAWAVKIAGASSSRRTEQVRRLYQEARAVSLLDHPNIVRLTEFGVDDASGQPYLVMELAPGRSLASVVGAEGPFVEPLAIAVARQLLSALSHAHERGILHRDLTPANVTVDRTGTALTARLLDFGLARMTSEDEAPPLTQPGSCIGTPAFMSPEQITAGVLDARSDLYAVGCLLHFMITGAPPFAGGDALGTMQAQLRMPAPKLDLLSGGRAPSAALRRLHSALLEKSRFDRPESARNALSLYDSDTTEPPPLEGTPESGPGLGPGLASPISPRSPKIAAAVTLPLGTHLQGEGSTVVVPRPLDASDAAPLTTVVSGGVALSPPRRASRSIRLWWIAPISVALLLGIGWAVVSLSGGRQATQPRAASPAAPRPTPPAPEPRASQVAPRDGRADLTAGSTEAAPRAPDTARRAEAKAQRTKRAVEPAVPSKGKPEVKMPLW